MSIKMYDRETSAINLIEFDIFVSWNYFFIKSNNNNNNTQNKVS